MKKWIPNFFYPHEFAQIENYLENQAAKGWILEQVGLYGFTFCKDAPSHRRYCIDVPVTGGEFKNREAYLEDYIPMCQDAGWTYVGTNDRIYIFTTEEETAIPLHTDPEVRRQAIEREWKPRIRAYIGLLLFLLGSGYYDLKGLNAQWLPRLSHIVIVSLSVLHILIDTELVWAYLRWSKGQEQNAMTGDWRYTDNGWPVKVRIFLHVLSGIGILLWLGLDIVGLVQEGGFAVGAKGLLESMASFPVIYGLTILLVFGLPALFWKKGLGRDFSRLVPFIIALPVLLLWIGISADGLERIQWVESGMAEKVAFLKEVPITCEELGLTGADITNYRKEPDGPYEEAGSYTVTWSDGRYLHYICEYYEEKDTAVRIFEKNDEYAQRTMERSTEKDLRYEWISKELVVAGFENASLYAEYQNDTELIRYVYNMQKGNICLRLTYVSTEKLTAAQLQVIAEQLP
ncbi:MAG: DUF2812 domain-containing protein [Lachnospiraceae bacterium]|nr:DUF2812 domain-containing protein [Lachnospiraceae bacterium]